MFYIKIIKKPYFKGLFNGFYNQTKIKKLLKEIKIILFKNISNILKFKTFIKSNKYNNYNNLYMIPKVIL